MISTGIEKLDAEFGGFEEGRCYVAKGGPGTGKTLLGLTFLAAGLDRHETGLLVTSERPRALVAQAEEADFALESAIVGGRLTVLEYPEALEDLSGPLSGLDLADALAELSRHLEATRASRVVIDPVSPLFLFGRTRDPATFARVMVAGLSELGPTVLLTAEADTSAETQVLLAAAEHHVYGTIELSLVPAGDVFERRMRVIRLRGGPARQAGYRFEVRKGRITFPERAGAPGAAARGRAAPVSAPPGGAEGALPLARPGAPAVITAPPAYIQELMREAARAKRYERPFSVALFGLQSILEGVGREAPVRGETLARRLFQVFEVTSRDTETIARYSWDKVLVFLPETPRDGALVFVRRILRAMREALVAERVYDPASFPEVRYGMASYPEDLAAGDLLDLALVRLVRPAEG